MSAKISNQALLNNLRNPRRGVYMVFTNLLRRPVPVPLARLMAIGARAPLAGAAALPTYDGSGQACHPSVAAFRGRTYMACTPFPYYIDFYENPSLYVREEDRWRPVPGVFPLVRPRRLGHEYYSDPCLFPWENRLVLLFRKCEDRAGEWVDLLYTVSSVDGADWTAPRLLAEGKDSSLLSPAVGGASCSAWSAMGRIPGWYGMGARPAWAERPPAPWKGLIKTS